MTDTGLNRRALFAASLTLAAASASPAAAQTRRRSPRTSAELAPRPPMGWNSWNSFATTITEAQAIETAGIMAAKLLPFGYDVFTGFLPSPTLEITTPLAMKPTDRKAKSRPQVSTGTSDSP